MHSRRTWCSCLSLGGTGGPDGLAGLTLDGCVAAPPSLWMSVAGPVTTMTGAAMLAGMPDHPDPLAIAFGRRLAQVREAKGKSQAELAVASGVKRAYIWRVEDGRTLPSLRTAAKLAAGLGVTMSTLLETL